MAAGAEEAAPWSRAAPHMGCLWTLSLPGTPASLAEPAADAVFAEIARLNQIFSDYQSTSELNQLCATAGQSAPVPVSAELFGILSLSRSLSEISGGLFDITLAPCVRLWRRSRRRAELPDPAALAHARALAGSQAMELDPARQTVRLTKPGMQLDLGGIAKGWTQDACLRLLRDRFQITCVLLDAAGEVAAGTPPAGRSAWQIGLQAGAGGKAGRISVKQANVATSGDLYQFVSIGGRRYSHIIDPRTGLGSTISRQGTIIAATGSLADPLAKVLCLTDPETSLALLQRHYPQVHARVTQSSPGLPLLVRQSSGFPAVEA